MSLLFAPLPPLVLLCICGKWACFVSLLVAPLPPLVLLCICGKWVCFVSLYVLPFADAGAAGVVPCMHFIFSVCLVLQRSMRKNEEKEE